MRKNIKMEKEKFNEEEFKGFLNGLVDSFDKEYLESPIFKHFFENSKYLSDPDELQTMIIHPFERAVELVIQNKMGKSKEVASLYLDYAFLEDNISQICSELYGSGCSVDRGRLIVKSYIKWKETGIMPKFDWEQEYTFHYPESGTMEEWMNLVAGVERLKYGYYSEYLKALLIIKSKSNNGAKEEPIEVQEK